MTGSAAPPPAAGVLLFSCLGRGRALFNEANYDSRMAHISTGVPVAGVFCNGEIGPVHGSREIPPVSGWLPALYVSPWPVSAKTSSELSLPSVHGVRFYC